MKIYMILKSYAPPKDIKIDSIVLFLIFSILINTIVLFVLPKNKEDIRKILLFGLLSMSIITIIYTIYITLK